MIYFVKGDATNPLSNLDYKDRGLIENKLIIHVCNDIGGWGKGFVLALSNKWKEPEERYRLWAKNKLNIPFKLGEIDIISVDKENNISVCNMIAQHDVRWQNNIPPIRYDSLGECFKKIRSWYLSKSINSDIPFILSIHMPRIGCGLAGGKWEKIEERIKTDLYLKDNYNIVVYDL